MNYRVSSTNDLESAALILFCKAHGFNSGSADADRVILSRELFEKFSDFLVEFARIVKAVECNPGHNWPLHCEQGDETQVTP